MQNNLRNYFVEMHALHANCHLCSVSGIKCFWCDHEDPRTSSGRLHFRVIIAATILSYIFREWQGNKMCVIFSLNRGESPQGLVVLLLSPSIYFCDSPPTPQPPLFKPYPALCALRLLRLRGWSHAGIFLPALTNSFLIVEELFAAWKQGLGRIGRMQVRGGFMLLLLFYPLNFCEQIRIKHLQLYLDVCVCACICLCMQNRNTDQKLKKMTLWKVLGKKESNNN